MTVNNDDLINADGTVNASAVMRMAHQRARRELEHNARFCAADPTHPRSTYAAKFSRELLYTWRYVRECERRWRAAHGMPIPMIEVSDAYMRSVSTDGRLSRCGSPAQ